MAARHCLCAAPPVNSANAPARRRPRGCAACRTMARTSSRCRPERPHRLERPRGARSTVARTYGGQPSGTARLAFARNLQRGSRRGRPTRMPAARRAAPRARHAVPARSPSRPRHDGYHRHTGSDAAPRLYRLSGARGRPDHDFRTAFPYTPRRVALTRHVPSRSARRTHRKTSQTVRKRRSAGGSFHLGRERSCYGSLTRDQGLFGFLCRASRSGSSAAHERPTASMGDL